ncbi:MAG: hypothetical protein ACYC2H_10930 [Thermoplasmatota archaeon]
MMKLLPMLLLSLIMAGCAEPPETSSSVSPPINPAASGPEERIKEWDGTLTGAGKILPDGSVRFYGQFTTPERFTIDEEDTNLTVTMTWDHTVAQPFFMQILNGETNYRVQSSPPFDGAVGVTYHASAPIPGQWSAIGLVDGVAVDAKYHIRVEIQ